MSASPSQNPLVPAPRSLTDRCRTLGLPVWRFDPKGTVIAEPTSWGRADPWLRSSTLRDLIDHAAAQWLGDASTPIVDLFPGCWLLMISDGQTPTSGGVAVAMALAHDALDSEHFAAICGDAGLNPESAKGGVSRLARFRRGDLDQLVAILQWMNGDLLHAAEHDGDIRVFSQQLGHAYEQISLLYRLGRSMNCLSNPAEFIEMTCTLLHSTLDYGWIGVKLGDEDAGKMGLPTRCMLAGSLPCAAERFDGLTAELLGQISTDHWTLLLNESRSGLAALVGSLVVADPIMCGGHVAGVLLAGNKGGADRDVSSVDTQLLDAVADYLGAFLHNVAMFNEQRSMFMGTIQAMTAAIDAKDHYTRGHSERVAMSAWRLALATGMTEEQAERVRIAGLVHDVGKIGVAESVLQKPGSLTDEEFEQIKRHPTIGYNILKDIEPMADVLPGVLYHHERWDGHGYPEGRRGEDIPYMGRLLAVADAFDAMSSDRSYRSAIPRQKVLAEIAEKSGTQFDPELAEVFVTLDLEEYDAMVARHREQEAAAA